MTQPTEDMLAELIRCDRIMHNWARYIGHVGYRNVTPVADNSHANFEWDGSYLRGRDFERAGNSAHLRFRVDDRIFTIHGSNGVVLNTIETDGVSMQHVSEEFDRLIPASKENSAHFREGLEFRYPKVIKADGVSETPSTASLALWKQLRTGANKQLAGLLKSLEIQSEIRIWPSNFDTGIFYRFPNDVELYAGFAPADDEVLAVPYFYSSMYKNGAKVAPLSKPDMAHGEIMDQQWKGAAFGYGIGSDPDEFIEQARQFLEESTNRSLHATGTRQPSK